jgi:stearoyl-CoA desaturase (delta-9 desaturase)
VSRLAALRALRANLAAWFDAGAPAADVAGGDPRRIDLVRLLPFLAIHAGCLAVPWVGVSATAIFVAIAAYALRMFAITAFYHRYFAHRAFRTSRATQFVFAVLGASAAQRGPLWWASHHRHHHLHSDTALDSHSALQHGLLWSHAGWFMARANFRTRSEHVGSFARFPELRFLDRFDALVPLLLCGALVAAGGLQLLVWGFCVSTVVLYHATFSINSLCHRFGTRRYATGDASRNNAWLALLTFGEGWHNNHHHYPVAARQGFFWWEIDLAYYGLRALAALRIVHDLKAVPRQTRAAGRLAGAA